MVGTRNKNKDAHPGAPAMTNAAKIKAGIPTKKQQRGRTKDEQIRELKALVAAANNTDDTAAISKEPLVCRRHSCYGCLILTTTQFTRDTSPPEDTDMYAAADSEAPTEVDTDEFAIVGGKRAPPNSYNPRYVAC